ncbi:enoyl-CoA hydratase-related protein [Histidinibacterium lentulum]|uniref:Enoyl-CoA hydratase n=1 Tax=Histidinibacterium lentulum TaxID=2480588 RepID=A0A3N2R9J9_9RHOB|nr:enoyl-CoA hydratase-related protein [Histidinibacterium lentulum]ROU04093.1 enoyl-CoA hydratase [Histidinibacterium lentulum]
MTEELHADGRLRLAPGPVAVLTLSAPERRNAVSRAMWAALPELCARIDRDDGIRVLILTGEGDTFSAGADISEFAESYATPDEAGRTNAVVHAGQTAVAGLSKPVIARIRGACVGGGCGLALSADLRFAASDARLGIPPARLGLAYSFSATRQLVTLVGPARAKDILFSARLIGAEEALAIGLTDRCLPPETLDAETLTYAETLAGLSQVSIRTAKAMIEAIRAGADAEPDTLRAAYDASFGGPDFAEGCRAFLEKRPPRFS